MFVVFLSENENYKRGYNFFFFFFQIRYRDKICNELRRIYCRQAKREKNQRVRLWSEWQLTLLRSLYSLYSGLVNREDRHFRLVLTCLLACFLVAVYILQVFSKQLRLGFFPIASICIPNGERERETRALFTQDEGPKTPLAIYFRPSRF